ncbi:MAG: peptide ABC transporter permease [Chloroflexi bacterium HGW-Chloroflexi-1]|nr:MAG: peptide ABC transporter permease [Chloroflexi bacterium HGW-Chloroflexi-1]
MTRAKSQRNAPETRYASNWVAAWRRFRRSGLAMFGLVYFIIILFVAVMAPVISPYPYDRVDYGITLQLPTWQHLLGTDYLGRDMLTRLMWGARPMLLVGILTGAVGMVIGVPLGILAGYLGGAFDWFIQRLVDLFSALPWYLLVLYLVMVLSPSVWNLILALSVSSWVGSCRLVRGLTFSAREYDFVEAARALGIPTRQILARHVLPQIAPLLLWGFATSIPGSVFAEAGLSFLGIGIRPPIPSWGQMLGQAGQYWMYYWHVFLFPSLCIVISVLAFQGLADGLRQAIDVNVNV